MTPGPGSIRTPSTSQQQMTFSAPGAARRSPACGRTLPFVRSDQRLYVRTITSPGHGARAVTLPTPKRVMPRTALAIVLLALATAAPAQATTGSVQDPDTTPPVAGPAPVISGNETERGRIARFQRARRRRATLQIFDQSAVWAVSFEIPLDDWGGSRCPIPTRTTGSASVRPTPPATAPTARWRRPRSCARPGSTSHAARRHARGADDRHRRRRPHRRRGHDRHAPGGRHARTPQLTDPGAYGALLADCYGSPVALTDVRKAGKPIAISGLTAYAPGTEITIRDDQRPHGRDRDRPAPPGASRRPRPPAPSATRRSSAPPFPRHVPQSGQRHRQRQRERQHRPARRQGQGRDTHAQDPRRTRRNRVPERFERPSR